jgi:hypothetical protein
MARNGFILFKEVVLWELFLLAFVKKSKSQYLRNPEGRHKATGIAGILANKGGMQVSFQY